MRKLFLIALLLALTADAADARRRHHRGDRAYAMERGSIAALVPADWQLQPSDPDWQGDRYVSPTGHAWLAFYARPADEAPRDQHLKTVAFVEGEEITYLRREPDWLTVSGFKGGRIFYRKVVLACGERTWRHVAFEYPAEAKRAFDRLVTRVARALDREQDKDCDAVVGSN